MEYLINQGILELICHCLKLKDAKYIAVSIEGLGNLLSFGKQYYTVDGKNLILQKLEQLGMYDVLENLQCHPVEVVYEKTIKLLETYFETENQN
jgi:importin subunit alpha-1